MRTSETQGTHKSTVSSPSAI